MCQFLNYLRLSSRMESLAQRIAAAHNASVVCLLAVPFLVFSIFLSDPFCVAPQLNGVMVGVSGTLKQALQTMDIQAMTKTMDQFETQMNDMAVREGLMNTVLNTQMGMVAPEEQVDSLLQQVSLASCC